MNPAPELKVSAIIPTFNARRLLSANLPKVFKALRDGDQLIVVDDAGSDDTAEWLRKEYFLELVPRSHVDFEIYQGKLQKIEVLLIVNRTNLRFGASCNRAAEIATGEILWLINNDVVPEADVIDHVLPHFAKPQMFAVGCKELQDHDAHKPAGKAKLWFAKGLFHHSSADNYQSGQSDWVNGGSSFFSHSKWQELGGFDHDYYPAYWEDIDVCYRARQKGWVIWFEAQAVVHHQHETTNQSVFGQAKIDEMSWKNGQVFTRKNSNWWQKIMFYLWQPYWQAKHQRYQASQQL